MTLEELRALADYLGVPDVVIPAHSRECVSGFTNPPASDQPQIDQIWIYESRFDCDEANVPEPSFDLPDRRDIRQEIACHGSIEDAAVAHAAELEPPEVDFLNRAWE